MTLSPAAATLLATLRSHVESTDEYADGTRFGQVYLPNCGSGHSFAGLLSALEAADLYRPCGDSRFGMVRLAAKTEDRRAAAKAAWAALKAKRTFNNPLHG